MHELSRKALIDQAVGLQRHQVEAAPLAGPGLHVLRSHDKIVGGPHGAVREELRGVDVVVVALALVVEEDLLVLAAPALDVRMLLKTSLIIAEGGPWDHLFCCQNRLNFASKQPLRAQL